MGVENQITMGVFTWFRLVGELRERGGGRRESGAFLLGKTNDPARRITEFVCYDDLDRTALDKGYVLFHGPGYSALWTICSARKLEVLADIHTHPGPDVGQSSIDQKHPMLPVVNHVALIAPRFGHTSRWSLREVGVHVFEGGGRWRRHDPKDPSTPIRISYW